jgi:hypothetical protein
MICPIEVEKLWYDQTGRECAVKQQPKVSFSRSKGYRNIETSDEWNDHLLTAYVKEGGIVKVHLSGCKTPLSLPISHTNGRGSASTVIPSEFPSCPPVLLYVFRSAMYQPRLHRCTRTQRARGHKQFPTRKLHHDVSPASRSRPTPDKTARPHIPPSTFTTRINKVACFTVSNARHVLPVLMRVRGPMPSSATASKHSSSAKLSANFAKLVGTACFGNDQRERQRGVAASRDANLFVAHHAVCSVKGARG